MSKLAKRNSRHQTLWLLSSECLLPLAALTFLLAASPAANAQAGDAKGEVQPDLPEDLEIPAAPALSPDEALKSFRTAPGIRVELVASDPMINDPVHIAFDADGRMWVVEMRGYMPDLDGTDEERKNGTIAVLEDTNGDGRMDKRHNFLEGLVLPRAVAPTRGGALVIANAELFFCADEDGDGRGDQQTFIAGPFPESLNNPEHAINSLTYSLDNRWHVANHSKRYLFTGNFEDNASGYLAEGISRGGQWGMGRDDEGRFYFNHNPDPLRWHRVDPSYAVRNPNYGSLRGINERLAHDRRLWPLRISPGVNRGYRPGTLNDDYFLEHYTAACGPGIYRGDLFPEFVGDAFACEPAGYLVKQFQLSGHGSKREATCRFEGVELLASTDERFRPVQVTTGPEGAIYVVDFYRGLFQHKRFLTTFLRKQAEKRGLHEHAALGRIWRLVPDVEPDAEAEPRRVQPRLSDASWSELTATIAHPNGIWRDIAQRLLVEEGREDPDARELVRELFFDSSTPPLGVMHALMTMAGWKAADEEVLLYALKHSDQRVVRAGARAAEHRWSVAGRSQRGRLVSAALSAAASREGKEPDPATRLQIMLSLGASGYPDAGVVQRYLLTEDCSSADLRSAALSGWYQQEFNVLRTLLTTPGWTEEKVGRPELLSDLALCVARSGVSEHIIRVAERASEELVPWRQTALLMGLGKGRPPGPTGKPGRLKLSRALSWYEVIQANHGVDPSETQQQLLDITAWPGRTDLPPEEVVRPLNPAEQELFQRGRELYGQVCAACHLPSGRGAAGQAPPLRNSPWVLGSKARTARILMNGLVGPITLNGETWNAEMPAWSVPDEDLAAVLTYIRREWGHGATPVSVEEIQELQRTLPTRSKPWTVEELE